MPGLTVPCIPRWYPEAVGAHWRAPDARGPHLGLAGLETKRSERQHGEMSRVTLEKTADQLGNVWVVERVGAEAVTFRVAQQTQWEQAEAVRDGRQPRIDP